MKLNWSVFREKIYGCRYKQRSNMKPFYLKDSGRGPPKKQYFEVWLIFAALEKRMPFENCWRQTDDEQYPSEHLIFEHFVVIWA